MDGTEYPTTTITPPVEAEEMATPALDSTRVFSPFQELSLVRLYRMSVKRTYCLQHPEDFEEPLLRALDHAVYSLYRDCTTEGVGEEAQRILDAAARFK